MRWVAYDEKEGRICCERSEKWLCDSFRARHSSPKQVKVMDKTAVPRAALKAWKQDLADATTSQDWDRLADHSIFQERTLVEMWQDELDDCKERIKTLQRLIKKEQSKAAA